MKLTRIVFILTLIILCAKYSYGQKGYSFSDSSSLLKFPDVTETVKGNTFFLSFGSKQDYIDNDPRREEAKNSPKRLIDVEQYVPLKVNGNKIFYNYDKEPTTKGGHPFRIAVLKAIEPEVVKLGDGEYILNMLKIVFDENGKTIFFDTEGSDITSRYSKPLKKGMYLPIKNLIISTLENLQMNPVYNGMKKVSFGILCPFMTVYIVVQNGQVTYYNLP